MSQGNTERHIPDACTYVQYGLPDWRHDYARFKHGVEEVRTALQNGENVLVHCDHGQSRSVCVAETGARANRFGCDGLQLTRKQPD